MAAAGIDRAAEAASLLLVWEPIDTARILAAVADDAAGANVLFTGTTRGVTAGIQTRRLAYEAHEPLARAELARLRDEAVAKYALTACMISHRLGEVDRGTTIIVTLPQWSLEDIASQHSATEEIYDHNPGD